MMAKCSSKFSELGNFYDIYSGLLHSVDATDFALLHRRQSV